MEEISSGQQIIWKKNKKSTRKMKFVRSLVTTILIIILAYSFEKVLSVFNIMDQLQKSVLDFDFTDIYYSKFFSGGIIDTDIIIVNISNHERTEIAKLIDDILLMEPKVIGIDAFFSLEKGDPHGDSLLAESLNNIPDLVMASSLMFSDNGVLETIRFADSFQKLNCNYGYVNLNIPESDKTFGTVRSFYNKYPFENAVHFPFAFEIARKFNPDVSANYPIDKIEELYVNFKGYAAMRAGIQSDKYRFIAYDWERMSHLDRHFIQDKIVLIGMLGTNLDDEYNYEDKFFSPMNSRVTARALPDMYGVEIHANIISMILKDQYIWNSNRLNFIISMLILFLIVVLFDKLLLRSTGSYQLISKVIVLILINILILMNLEIFHHLKFKIDIRYLIFFLVITPDIQEFVYYQLFRRIGWIKKEK